MTKVRHLFLWDFGLEEWGCHPLRLTKFSLQKRHESHGLEHNASVQLDLTVSIMVLSTTS